LETVSENQQRTPPEILKPANRSPLLLAFSLLLTALAYVGTLRFQFVYDDLPQIVRNPFIVSWHSIPRYFTMHVWSHIFPNQPGNYYRPIFMLWLLLNHSLFGLHPWGWHATAVALHVLTTYLVYLLARELAQERTVAVIASAIFGLHPAHIEAVSWISAVTELLFAVTYIAAFLCYLKARAQKPGARWWFAGSLGFYVLSLLSKETAVVFPGILLGYEWLFRDLEQPAFRNKRLLRSIPFIALTAVYLGVREAVLKVLAASQGHSIAAMIFTVPSLAWLYIRHLLFPVRLSAFYDLGLVRSPSLRKFALPLLGVALTIALLWLWARRSRVVAFCALWLLLPMLPPLVSIAYFQEGDMAHDRYLYVPSVGFAIIAALALQKLRWGKPVFGRPASQVAATLVIVLLLGVATGMQHVYWSSNLLLYSRGVEIAPRNVLAWKKLGTEMLARGQRDTAIEMYQHSLQIDPNIWTTNLALGIANYESGHWQEAEGYLLRAIRLEPTNSNQFFYLGLVRLNLGRWTEAESAFRRAIQLWPSAAGFHYALAAVLEKQGRLAAAREEYKAELGIEPGNAEARRQLAAVETRLRPENKKGR